MEMVYSLLSMSWLIWIGKLGKKFDFFIFEISPVSSFTNTKTLFRNFVISYLILAFSSQALIGAKFKNQDNK